MEQEFWRSIIYKGEETKYEVSSLGRVRHVYTLKIKKAHKRKDGYLYYQLHIGGKIKKINIHRLVAEAFIEGKSDERNEVNHIDGNKTNNTIYNLEWVSRKENIRHAFDNNLIVRGREFDSPNNIYSSEMVKIFCISFFEKGLSVPKACQVSGIELSTGYRISRGERYKEILDELGFIPAKHTRTNFDKFKDEIIKLVKENHSPSYIRKHVIIPDANDSNYNYYIRKIRKLISSEDSKE